MINAMIELRRGDDIEIDDIEIDDEIESIMTLRLINRKFFHRSYRDDRFFFHITIFFSDHRVR